MGRMGHAFFAFTPKAMLLSDGEVYQFNLLAGLQRKETYFGLSRENAYVFSQRYRRENRALIFFPIRMEESEIRRLQELLEAERLHRDRFRPQDYELMKNNCITKILEFLDRVLPDRSRHPSLWFGEIDGWKDLFSRSTYLNNTPMFYTLFSDENAGLLGKPKFLLPAADERIDLARLMSQKLRKIAKVCQWSEESLRILLPLIAHEKLRNSKNVLSEISRRVRACALLDEGVAQLHVEFTDLYFLQNIDSATREFLLQEAPLP